MKNGDKVQFSGFSNCKRAARKGRNPQTGEEVEIASSKVHAYTQGRNLSETVKTSN